jgi:subtilisin family serine protease
MKTPLGAWILAMAATTVAPWPASAQVETDPLDRALADPSLRFVPGELIVQFRPGVQDQVKQAVLQNVDGRTHRELRRGVPRGDPRGDLQVVRSGPGNDVARSVRALRNHPAVEFVEPNWVYTKQAASNDPSFLSGSLWGLYGPGTSPSSAYGSQAAAAWALGNTCSSAVYVGVIDEGVMTSHPDLAGNFGVNPGEVPGNGIDDDGNGYIDDVNGWDFDGEDNTVFDGIEDEHGTHVAGIIGARGGNGTGIVGVCWNVKILVAKFLGINGGTTANAVRALDYFVDLKQRHGINIVATNNSWSGGGYSKTLSQAIERANAAGILFIAAAGNGGYDGVGDNIDNQVNYPASYKNGNVVTVTAINSSGRRPSFANFGKATVDLGAPGASIRSTVPKLNSSDKVVAGYASLSGTSMATAFVTGAAALYASSHPGATAAQIKAAILGSTVPTPALDGKTVTGGRLNVSGF